MLLYAVESVHRDLKILSDALDNDDTNLLKQIIIGLFRDYVQVLHQNNDDVRGKGGNGNNKMTENAISTTKVLVDPEKTYNRDREQMERNIVSLSRLVQSGTGKFNSLCLNF
jgi:hypothetical protein